MNCDKDLKKEPLVVSNHDYVETYNDGKTQLLKCEVCGDELVTWNDKTTTDLA